MCFFMYGITKNYHVGDGLIPSPMTMEKMDNYKVKVIHSDYNCNSDGLIVTKFYLLHSQLTIAKL